MTEFNLFILALFLFGVAVGVGIAYLHAHIRWRIDLKKYDEGMQRQYLDD